MNINDLILLKKTSKIKNNKYNKYFIPLYFVSEIINSAFVNDIYLYRITHIDNIPHILKNGITHLSSKNKNPNFISIGDKSLINKRQGFSLNKGKLLGDYIPFYFAYRTPMLYVIQKGYNGLSRVNPEDIVYCVSSVRQIIKAHIDFVFTDGYAVDKLSTQYTKADIENIQNIIDWDAIRNPYWINLTDTGLIDTDLKRRKEAEFLVAGDIPFNAIEGFVVYNKEAKGKIDVMTNLSLKIKIAPKYYF